jgi:hypothetical protein
MGCARAAIDKTTLSLCMTERFPLFLRRSGILGEITSQYDVPQIDRIDQVCESDAEVSTRFLQNLQNDPVTATCSIRNTGNELQIPAELEQSIRNSATCPETLLS